MVRGEPLSSVMTALTFLSLTGLEENRAGLPESRGSASLVLDYLMVGQETSFRVPWADCESMDTLSGVGCYLAVQAIQRACPQGPLGVLATFEVTTCVLGHHLCPRSSPEPGARDITHLPPHHLSLPLHSLPVPLIVCLSLSPLCVLFSLMRSHTVCLAVSPLSHNKLHVPHLLRGV